MQQLLLMYCMWIKKERYGLLMFKPYNWNCEKQVILSMISNGEKREAKSKGRWWLRLYLGVKKLSALLRGIISKNNGNFYCLNCLHFFGTKNKLESHKRVSENKSFCYVIMSSEDTKILEFNQY